MSSGLKSVVGECEDIFNSFARKHMYVGAFGNGIKFKILANLLVTVHNTVAAEALLLGQKAGLDEEHDLQSLKCRGCYFCYAW